MAKMGKFIADRFLNKAINLMTGNSLEWLSYQDGEAMSYMIIHAIPIEYDDDSGILTCKNDKDQVFYVSEDSIEMFWDASSGFKLMENTTATVRPGKQKNRDIM